MEEVDWSSLHKVLSDVTRRSILDLLAEKGTLSHTEILRARFYFGDDDFGVATHLDFAYFSDDFIFYCFNHTLTLLKREVQRSLESPPSKLSISIHVLVVLY